MTDSEQARNALAEVARRREEVARIAGRDSAPKWTLVVIGVVSLLMGVVNDLRTQVPGWNGWFTRWAVPVIGVLILATCCVIVYRRASVTLHNSASGPQIATTVVLATAFVVCLLGIGMPMRYYRIPFDQSVSLAGAALLVGAGWLVWRAVCARRS